MSKSNALENALLLAIFNATAIANLLDNAASSPLTTLPVALHTADPAEGGSQSTSEIAYTGYARVNVTRSGAGWTVTGNSVSPAANIDFGVMTAGAGGTVTHFSVGTGVGMYSGTVTPNIVVTNGIAPRLTTTSTITED